MRLDQSKWNALMKTVKHAIYWLLMTIFVFTLVVSPFVFYSAYRDMITNGTDEYAVKLITSAQAEKVILSATVNSVDVINKTANITLKGYKDCKRGCPSLGQKLYISSFSTNPGEKNKIEDSVELALPDGIGVFKKDFDFPIHGAASSYPFDRWDVDIAFAILDKAGKPLPSGRADVIFDDNVPRLSIENFTAIDPHGTNSRFDDFYAAHVSFTRPFHVKYTTVVLLVLLFIAMASTVVFTTHDRLIMSSAGIILGIWGARSLLLGNMPPELTFVDIILLSIVMIILMASAFKIALYIRDEES